MEDQDHKEDRDHMDHSSNLFTFHLSRGVFTRILNSEGVSLNEIYQWGHYAVDTYARSFGVATCIKCSDWCMFCVLLYIESQSNRTVSAQYLRATGTVFEIHAICHDFFRRPMVFILLYVCLPTRWAPIVESNQLTSQGQACSRYQTFD